MAQLLINIGSVPNDDTGDTGRQGGAKINANFTELYSAISGLHTVSETGNYADLEGLPTLGSVSSLDGWPVPDGGTDGQLLAKSSNVNGELEWVDPGEGGGGGGITNVEDDTSPTLGGNLDVSTFTVGDADTADLTKLSNITASAVEVNYSTGVTSAIQTQLDAKVVKSTFDANTILKADSNDTPVALTVGETTIVGRPSGGSISALTAAQVRTIINVENGATADMTGAEIATALETLTTPNRLDYTAIEGLDSEPAAILYETALQARTDSQNRAFLVNINGLAVASGEVAVEDNIIVGAANDFEIKYGATVSATYASKLEHAVGTDDTKLVNVANREYWRLPTVLTYANPATVVLDGSTHSLFVNMTATGNSQVQVGAIAAGLEGQVLKIEVYNSDGGAKTIAMQTHAGTGATLVTATGHTPATLGSSAGNVVVFELEIVTVGATGKVRLIRSYAAAS